MFQYKLYSGAPLITSTVPPGKYFGPYVDFVQNPDGSFSPPGIERTQEMMRQMQLAEMRNNPPSYHIQQQQVSPAMVHVPRQETPQPPSTQAAPTPTRSGRVQPFINQVIGLREKRNMESRQKFPHAHPVDFMNLFQSSLGSGAITPEDAPFIFGELGQQNLVNLQLPEVEDIYRKYGKAPQVEQRREEPSPAQNPMPQPTPDVQGQPMPVHHFIPFERGGNDYENLIPPYIAALRQAAENPPQQVRYIPRPPGRRERMNRVMQNLRPEAFSGEIEEDEE